MPKKGKALLQERDVESEEVEDFDDEGRCNQISLNSFSVPSIWLPVLSCKYSVSEVLLCTKLRVGLFTTVLFLRIKGYLY